MLLDYIEKLRERPRAERKRFAFFFALGVTGVVATGWALTLPANFSAFSEVGSMSSESVCELGANVEEATSELQQAIDMGELGYQPDEPLMLEQQPMEDSGTAAQFEAPAPETPSLPPAEPKQRPVMIATSSSEMNSQI